MQLLIRDLRRGLDTPVDLRRHVRGGCAGRAGGAVCVGAYDGTGGAGCTAGSGAAAFRYFRLATRATTWTTSAAMSTPIGASTPNTTRRAISPASRRRFEGDRHTPRDMPRVSRLRCVRK